MDDLPPLPWYDEPLLLLARIQGKRRKWQKTLWTVRFSQQKELLAMIAWVSLSFAVELVTPFAMYQLLAYLHNPDDATLHPALWLFLMFTGSICRCVSFQQYVFTSTRLFVRIKSAMTQELYYRAMYSMELEEDSLNNIVHNGKDKRKGATTKLASPDGEPQSTSAGRLANLMASEVDAIYIARDVILAGVGVPVGLIISIVGLYHITGWASLVGAGLVFFSAVLSAKLAQKMGTHKRVVKKAQDSRISLITEYLGSIKAIKYFAWEDAMMERVLEARSREQKGLWKITVLWVLFGQTLELMPLLALLAIFSIHVGVLKKPLTAPVAFTTLALITIMRRNVMIVSSIVNSVIAATISLDRLDRYFANTLPVATYPAGTPRHGATRRQPLR